MVTWSSLPTAVSGDSFIVDKERNAHKDLLVNTINKRKLSTTADERCLPSASCVETSYQ